MLEAETYNALIATIRKDCRVLESFKIMDYSLLIGIHNIDLAAREQVVILIIQYFFNSLLKSLGELEWCESVKGTSEKRGRAKDAKIRPQAKVGQQFDADGIDPGANRAHRRAGPFAVIDFFSSDSIHF